MVEISQPVKRTTYERTIGKDEKPNMYMQPAHIVSELIVLLVSCTSNVNFPIT